MRQPVTKAKPQATPETAPLGLLAGGGSLPRTVIDHCLANGKPVFVVTFDGQPQPDLSALGKAQQASLNIGAVGKVLATLHKNGVQQVVMAGHLIKPSIFTLRPDIKGATLLAKLARHHDDDLLRLICATLEKDGFTVIGPHDVVPGLLAAEGPLGRITPSEQDLADLRLGYETALHLGRADIGQAVVVKRRVVVGVEAVEGTDRLIERCAPLRGDGKGGVLVKVAKPGQDRRVDLPAVGPATITALARLGYSGLGIAAGDALLLEREKTLALANKHGLFVVGLRHV